MKVTAIDKNGNKITHKNVNEIKIIDGSIDLVFSENDIVTLDVLEYDNMKIRE